MLVYVAGQDSALSAPRLPANVDGLSFMSQSHNEASTLRCQGILHFVWPPLRFAGQVQNSSAAETMVLSLDFT